jgi:Kef-type K+ transport system membrane component KefB
MIVAPASSVHTTETLVFFVLLQLSLIVVAGRLGGVLAKRFKQSVAVGEIIVGILLGPSLFGWLFPGAFQYVFHSAQPQPMLVLSQIGLILLMFQIGLEFDFSHLRARENRRIVMRISLAALLVPFALGLGVGYVIAQALTPEIDPLLCGLFIATAFSITALPILGRIMIEFNLTRHPLGVIAISAAAINDVIGWLLLAAVTAITTAQFDTVNFALRFFALLCFVAVCWLLVRPALKRLIAQLSVPTKSPTAIDGLNNSVLALLLALIFIAAICTYQLGIFAIFGAFIVGVLLHDEHTLVAAWKERVGAFVNVFFLPIFFTYTGLRTDIGGLNSADLWGWCALIVALAMLGKYLPTVIVARWSGLSQPEARALGIMMNTRALMELIVLNIGFDLGVISRNIFTMLVIMAITSTIITAPVLRRQLPAILAGRAK